LLAIEMKKPHLHSYQMSLQKKLELPSFSQMTRDNPIKEILSQKRVKQVLNSLTIYLDYYYDLHLGDQYN